MRAGKTTHIFQLNGSDLKFSGNFDSGNLRTVVQTAPNHFEIEPAFDSYEVPATNKTFFHFYIESALSNQSIIVTVPRLSLLNGLRDDSKRYRPFVSNDGISYSRLDESQIEVIGESGQMSLRISLVFLSFALPYSYERYLNMVRDLPPSTSQIYINKEVLCYSPQLNLVYMLTITANTRMSQQQEVICENNGVILPERHLRDPRPFCSKPVILISARVHPGETGSSWAAQGIIKFLLGEHPDAEMIRQHFQVVIVPMLNPDGVEQGLYRLDPKGYNLNRYYLVSDNRQPSIYCMKHLIRHYHQTKRLLYYFDLHGHPSQKGAFVYGNAIDELPLQVETELFARLMTLICPTFQEKFCIFNRQQMGSKDKHDTYTKEGCARVFAFKLSGIVHSYTLEQGFHGLSDPSSDVLYSSQHYENEGRSLLVAVLMSSGLKEPPAGYTLHGLRKQLAAQITVKDERFRKQERHLQMKSKNVNEIIHQEYWKPIYEQHFSPTKQKRRFLNKKITNINSETKQVDESKLNFPSFFSEQTSKTTLSPQHKEQRTSLENLMENTKKRLDVNPTANGFRLLPGPVRTTHIVNKTKSQMEEKMVPRRLLNLPSTNNIGRRQESMRGTFREKLRVLKKPNALRSIETSYLREQEHLFCDLNIREIQKEDQSISPKKRPESINVNRRTQYASIGRQVSGGERSATRKNKIHSLFIEDHH